MTSRPQNRPSCAIAFACLVAFALFASPARAQNLLVNPGFDNGTIEGWTLEGMTRIVRFPNTGGVDLASSNPAGGGISQCVDTPNLPAGAQLDASLVVTLNNGPAGALRSFLITHPEPDCEGTALGSTLFAPTVDIGGTLFFVPVAMGGSLRPDPGTRSFRLFVLAAQPEPPAEFEFNLKDPVVRLASTIPEPGPDLTASLLVPLLRGRERLAILNLSNRGPVPTMGPFTVTITAPPGVRLVCADLAADCSGNGTGQLVITRTEPVPAFFLIEERSILLIADSDTPTGSLEIVTTVSGGGDTNPSNNTTTSSFELLPPRDATGASEAPPRMVNGRGRDGS